MSIDEFGFGLSAEDARWATWRRIPPIERGTPRSFDMAKLLQAVEKLKLNPYYFEPDWEPCGIPRWMGTEEARFWFEAITSLTKEDNAEILAARLSALSFDEPFKAGEIRARLDREDMARLMPTQTAAVLYFLVGAAELCGQLLDFRVLPNSYNPYAACPFLVLADGFREKVLPRLEEAELEACRAVVRPRFKKNEFAQYLGSCLGMHAECERAVDEWDNSKDGPYWWHRYNFQQKVILGMGSAERIDERMKKLRLRIEQPQIFRAWLACTGFLGLNYAVGCIVGQDTKAKAEALTKILAKGTSPGLAPAMVILAMKSRAPLPAKAWLEGHVKEGIEGILALVLNLEPEYQKGFIEQLRVYALRGYAQAIEQEARSRGDSFWIALKPLLGDLSGAAPVPDGEPGAEEIPAWLAEALRKPKAKTLPVWLVSETLPPLHADGTALSGAAVKLLLLALKDASFDKPLAATAALRERLSLAEREAFAWAVYDAWVAMGAPPADKWAYAALGHLGSDGVVDKLEPQIRRWPLETLHSRASFGLEVLRLAGTDHALERLNDIALTISFRALKRDAAACMERVAQDKGFTPSELQDRLAPRCGLADDGTAILDFGPRIFTVLIEGSLKPVVRDDSGKIRSDLPEPTGKDDEAKAAEAAARWRDMKKDLRAAAKTQISRFERDMVAGRRWKIEAFKRFVLGHPLLRPLAQTVLWAGYGADASFRFAFRVSAEGDFADMDDRTVLLEGAASIGIVHPLALSEESLKKWGEAFSDYSIIQPFPQLGRPVFRLDSSRGKLTDEPDFVSLSFPAPALIFGLEKTGWIRGPVQDGGTFCRMLKQFPGSGETALVDFDGCAWMGLIDGDEKLTVTAARFVEGLIEPTDRNGGGRVLSFAEVDPAAYSEFQRDLKLVAAKAN